MIPNRQNVPPSARVLTAIICLPPHSDWVSFCWRGRGGSLGLHTGNQWHRRIDSRANGWKEILTVCTAEPFPRAAAVGIFTVPDCIPASSVVTYISITSRHLKKRSVTKSWYELRTLVNYISSLVNSLWIFVSVFLMFIYKSYCSTSVHLRFLVSFLCYTCMVGKVSYLVFCLWI